MIKKENAIIIGVLALVGAYVVYNKYYKTPSPEDVVTDEEISNASGPTQAGASKDHRQVFCRCSDGANVVDCTQYRTVGDAANCVKCCRNHGGVAGGGKRNTNLKFLNAKGYTSNDPAGCTCVMDNGVTFTHTNEMAQNSRLGGQCSSYCKRYGKFGGGGANQRVRTIM